jgi:hypothetical protein
VLIRFLCHRRDKGIVAVYFDVPVEECQRRVVARPDHPTIPAGRGARIVESFAKKMEPPTKAEGFERVLVLRSFEETAAVLRSLGCSCS